MTRTISEIKQELGFEPSANDLAMDASAVTRAEVEAHEANNFGLDNKRYKELAWAAYQELVDLAGHNYASKFFADLGAWRSAYYNWTHLEREIYRLERAMVDADKCQTPGWVNEWDPERRREVAVQVIAREA